MSFANIAREIRCKWSPDNDKASLSSAQTILESHLADLKGDGRSVKRVVCGGCMDFKIITTAKEPDFGKFEEGGFAGEVRWRVNEGAMGGAECV